MTAHAQGQPAAPGTTAATPAARLVMSVALAGAFAGALIAYVYQGTLPAIQRFANERIEGAVRQVLGGPARLDTLEIEGQRAYVGYDAGGARIGVAVEAASAGFADEVRLMVGFDPATGRVTGYAVLGQKETPGLGDKIEKDSSFVARFRGKVVPLAGSKSATADSSTVQTITGATISSRVVIRIINDAVALWQPRLQARERPAAP